MMEDMKLAVKEMRNAIRSEVLDFKKKTHSISGYLSIDTSLYAIFALYARHLGNIEEVNGTFVTDRPLSNRESNIWHYFLPSVDKLKKQGVYDAFVSLVNNLFQYHAESYENAYSFIIDDLIDFLFNLNKTGEGCNSTPDCLLRFFARYAEANQCTSFYNPFAGFANFIKYLHPHCSYYGQEINEFHVALAQLRMDAYHMTSAEIDCANSFQEWKNDECDCIVADMPWNAPYIRLKDRVTHEFFFFTKVISSSARISFGLYPCNILWNTSSDYKAARKQAIELDMVDTIIQLPGGLFENTSVPACVIITNRQKAHPGYVRFVDASSLAKKVTQFKNTLDVEALMDLVYKSTDERVARLVPNDKVLSQDYALQPSSYLKIDASDNANLVKLSTVIGEKQIGTIERIDPEKFVRVVHIANLVSNGQDQDIDFSQLKPELFQHSCRYINEDALLLSRIARLKPTLYRNIQGGIYLHPNVFAFRIDTTKVLPDYLVQELNKEYVVKQIGAIGAYQSFSLPALLDIRIDIPSLEEQRKTLDALHKSEISSLNKELEEKYNKSHKDFLDILHSRKHNMEPLVGQISCAIDNIQTLLEGENIDSELQIELTECINDALSASKELGEDLERLVREEEFDAPELIDICDFMKKEFSCRYPTLGTYSVLPVKIDELAFRENFGSKQKAFIYIAKDALKMLLRNICANACKHGFTDIERENYFISSEVRLSDDRSKVIITITNNGNPWPQGMTKEVYSSHEAVGPTGGTGNGGAQVNHIVNKYNGDFNIGTIESDFENLVFVELQFPIRYENVPN